MPLDVFKQAVPLAKLRSHQVVLCPDADGVPLTQSFKQVSDRVHAQIRDVLLAIFLRMYVCL